MSQKLEIPVILPKMGESVSEATIIEWLKKPGDFIAKDELFVLIGTDKVESELPCEYEGVLKEILVAEKQDVEVGKPICIMLVDANQVRNLPNAAAKIEKAESQKSDSFKINTYTESNRFLSPVVRKIATKAGLELNELEEIKGSGENGRIRKQDILSYLDKDKSTNASFAPVRLNLKTEVGDTVSSLSRMQKLLADHLQQSFTEIPHVTTFAELDVTELVEHRENIKQHFAQKFNTKITYTHYLQYAVIQALKEFSLLNSWMNVDELIQKSNINLGFATSMPNGDLIVPNVKSVQNMKFSNWVIAVNHMAQKAKNGKLESDDVQSTTFTVSNTGMFGSLAGTPIISKPQVAVLALGEIISSPGVIVVNDTEQLAVRKKMILSVSYDHRIINGAYASLFLRKVKEQLAGFLNWF